MRDQTGGPTAAGAPRGDASSEEMTARHWDGHSRGLAHVVGEQSAL